MGERLIQYNFFPICPEGTRFPFTRSLHDVLTHDFLATIDFIRQAHIPNYSPHELAEFPEAFLWAKENLDKFLEAGFIGKTTINTLPAPVHAHHSCLSFLLFLGEDMFEMPKKQSVLPVAYTPQTERWQQDIVTITKPWLKKLKRCQENRTFNPGYISSTKTKAITQEAFLSGWSQNRAEASDLLTSQLFLSYWVTLKSRIRSAPF